MSFRKSSADFLNGRRRLALIAIGFVLAAYLYFSGGWRIALSFLGGLGYFSSFAIGVFFSTGLTTPSALLLLAELALQINPWVVCILGAAGATIGDYFLFKFFKAEAPSVSKLMRLVRLRVSTSKKSLLYKLTPLIAMLVLASPFPDEIAMALYGVEKYEERGFLFFTYLSKLVGLFAVSLAAGAVF